jgi:hypothetical protein
VTHMGEGRGAYRVLVGRPEGKRPLGSVGRTGFGWLRIGSSGGLS